jgi:serine/threonine protein phosphatase PrpC
MLEIRSSTAPGSADRENEDAFAVVDGLVVVADGATSPPTLGDGCRHGPAWYAHRLVSHLVAGHAEHPEAGAVVWLAEAITRTTAAHADTCDVGHPGTPSATVALLAVDDDQVSWLVLGDCALLLEGGNGMEIVTDDRLSLSSTAERGAVLAGDARLDAAEHARRVSALVHAQRAYRNRPGGFWVAAAEPAAAGQALTGSAPARQLRRAALLTDGLTRAVDPYRTHVWESLLDELAILGPADVLASLRRFEATDPDGVRFPRTKSSDDATAVVLTWPTR